MSLFFLCLFEHTHCDVSNSIFNQNFTACIHFQHPTNKIAHDQTEVSKELLTSDSHNSQVTDRNSLPVGKSKLASFLQGKIPEGLFKVTEYGENETKALGISKVTEYQDKFQGMSKVTEYEENPQGISKVTEYEENPQGISKVTEYEEKPQGMSKVTEYASELDEEDEWTEVEPGSSAMVKPSSHSSKDNKGNFKTEQVFIYGINEHFVPKDKGGNLLA